MPKKGSRKDIQAEIRQRVRHALLTVAPSEVDDAVRLAATEFLGEDVVIPTIADLARDLIGGQIINRASMYPEAAFATYQNNVMAREADEGVTLGRRVLEEGDNCEDCIAAASEEFVPLDELPEISDSICGPRCRCEFEFQIGDSQFAVSELFQGRIGGQEAFGGDAELN